MVGQKPSADADLARKIQLIIGGIKKKKAGTKRQKVVVKPTTPVQPVNDLDFLSKCPSLSQILFYLNPMELVNCQSVNRILFSCIKRNPSMMTKTEFNIQIDNVEKKEGVTVRCIAVGKEETNTEFNAQAKKLEGFTVMPGLADFLASQARGFELLQDRSLIFKVPSKATAIHWLFHFLLPQVQIKSLEVTETRARSILPLIRNCLAKYFKKQTNHIVLRFFCPISAIQSEISQILGCSRFSVNTSLVSNFSLSFNRLGPNPGSVDIQTYGFSSWDLQDFLLEWINGKRNINVIRLDSLSITEEMLNKLSFSPEVYRKVSEKEFYLIRPSDNMTIHVKYLKKFDVLRMKQT